MISVFCFVNVVYPPMLLVLGKIRSIPHIHSKSKLLRG